MNARQLQIARAATVALATAWVAVAWAAGESSWAVTQPTSLPAFANGVFRLSFADGDNGMAVGPGTPGVRVPEPFVGYRTSDGGATWHRIDIPLFRTVFRDGAPLYSPDGRPELMPGAAPYAVHVVDGREAWIGGAERLARTADGGRTWALVHLRAALPSDPDVQAVAARGRLNVGAVHFWDSQSGLVVCRVQEHHGEGDVVGSLTLATRDGAHSWEAAALAGVPGTPGVGGGRLTMTSRLSGWMVKHSGGPVAPGLYTIEDGWRTWRHVIRHWVADAYVATDGRAWAVAGLFQEMSRFNVVHSYDHGRTWQQSVLLADLPGEPASGPTGSVGVGSITFAPDGRGWAAGPTGVVLATRDGVHWTFEDAHTKQGLTDIQYIDGAVYAVAADGAVIKRHAATTAVGPAGQAVTAWGRVKGRTAR